VFFFAATFVRATIEGLTSMSSPQLVASKRGKTVEEITGEV
jgi:small subunit ribosomal protein S5